MNLADNVSIDPSSLYAPLLQNTSETETCRQDIIKAINSTISLSPIAENTPLTEIDTSISCLPGHMFDTDITDTYTTLAIGGQGASLWLVNDAYLANKVSTSTEFGIRSYSYAALEKSLIKWSASGSHSTHENNMSVPAVKISITRYDDQLRDYTVSSEVFRFNSYYHAYTSGRFYTGTQTGSISLEPGDSVDISAYFTTKYPDSGMHAFSTQFLDVVVMGEGTSTHTP